MSGGGFTVHIDVSHLRLRSGQFASFMQVFGMNIDEALRDRIGPKILRDLRNATPISDRPNVRHAYDRWSLGYTGSYARGSGQLVIENQAEYLRFVLEGTSPHMIFGNPNLIFFWQKAGRLFIGPYVNHPGTPANPFLEEVFDENRNYVLQEVGASVRISMAQAFGR